jgi:hypothetical protein
MKYIIIGAGPSGLAFANYASKFDNEIIIIDKDKSIGGCHRVKRVNNLFTEHSPRVYSTSYVNFIKLLKEMNIKFTDLFAPYNFTISTIGNKTIKNMKYYEMYNLLIKFISFIIIGSLGGSVKDFVDKYNFTNDTKDYLDRLCRLTDGASSDKYSLTQFFQLANQQSLYKLYQPKIPNDIGLFKRWRNYLESTGKVTFKTECDIKNIENVNNSIISITTSNNERIIGDKFIFAVPPVALRDILVKSNNQVKEAFGSYNKFNNWVEETEYADYISITYHWKEKIKLPKIWGFPSSTWGIVFIVTSDYSDTIENGYKTIISSSITIMNNKGFNNKTPIECNQNELIEECFMQIKEAFPQIYRYDTALICPNVYWKANEKKWESIDSAFFASSKLNNPFIPFESLKFNNLYTLGTHNGNSPYSFTSIESAVANASTLANLILKDKNIIYKPYTIRKLILHIIICICIIIITYKIYKIYILK